MALTTLMRGTDAADVTEVGLRCQGLGTTTPRESCRAPGPPRCEWTRGGSTEFPAVSPQMGNWYTTTVDTYFADRPEVLPQVMHGNAQTLLSRLSVNAAA
jgi:hypothetical protein